MATERASRLSEEAWNRCLRRGQARAQLLTREVELTIARELRAAGRAAAERFTSYQETATLAAGPDRPWTRPEADVLLDVKRLADALTRANKRMRERMVKASLADLEAELGISFDLRNPVINGALEQAGQNITNVAETVRLAIMRELDGAWQDGASIPQAAARVIAKVDGMSSARAVMIARTEIVGVSNGGAYAAAKITGAMTRKEWLTAGGAKHPRHHEYPGLDGQLRPLDQDFSVGGAPMKYPGDPAGPASEVVNCRCTIAFKK